MSFGPRDGRFAPSPTGALHLGNLRTALLAWLFARSHGAAFALRIEDLDPHRSKPEHEERQRADLRAIGIDWDRELPRQSGRGVRYWKALEALEADGRVYECFCSRAEIRAAAQAPHGPMPNGSYPGTCRHLTESERDTKRAEAGQPPALRLDARAAIVSFKDERHGETTGVADDFVLWRGDVAAYNLAVAVDDGEQGIGQVVRGDDLLETTPRQILVARLLGLSEPSYAHVPLVLGPDGARLAKRHGAVTMDEIGGGDAALAWIAQSLGLAEEGESVDSTELLARFDPARVPHEPTIYC